MFFDGFDAGDVAFRWGTVNTIGTSSTTRFGAGLSATVNNNARLVRSIAPTADFYMGCAVSAQALSTFNGPQFHFFTDSAANRQITVLLLSSGVVARRGDENGTILGSTSVSLAIDTWYWLEIRLLCADSGGRLVVKLDGATMVDYTGDTKNGGTSSNIDSVQVFGSGGSSRIDDFYGLDATGSSPYNTFLGDCKVVTLAPSGAGATTGMTPSTGANYTCVDELPYSATDYVTGATGQKDTYALTDLPSGISSVLAVQANAIAKKSDAGALSVKNVVRSSSTDYAGTATAILPTDTTVSTIRTTDPATSTTWTTSGVNALEVGAEVV